MSGACAEAGAAEEEADPLGSNVKDPTPEQIALDELNAKLEGFSRAVTLGDWEFVKQFLSAELSDEEAETLYLHLVRFVMLFFLNLFQMDVN